MTRGIRKNKILASVTQDYKMYVADINRHNNTKCEKIGDYRYNFSFLNNKLISIRIREVFSV